MKARRMKAVGLDRFGGVEALRLQTIPVPSVGEDEVLIHVEYAGLGEWDPFEREGGYARMLGLEPRFPYVLGSEGAGTVVEVGSAARRFAPGDRVHAAGFLNPKGGFYADYAAVPEQYVLPQSPALTVEQAAVVLGVGLTGLRGLTDVLRLQRGESLAIVGASGGIGHIALQLANALGARVLAIASGPDGVALVRRLGAEVAIDGRHEDVSAALQDFAPGGLDAALLTAGGATADRVAATVRSGGRVAYPNGVNPVPPEHAGVRLAGFNGEPEGEILSRLASFLETGEVRVHVGEVFPLERIADAHDALHRHHLGKLALRIR